MNEALLITYDNEVYSVGNRGHKVRLRESDSFTDEEIVSICTDFFNRHRDLAMKEKLVITMNPKDGGHELTFEPLSHESGQKIQGEFQVDLFLRYGRNLVFNDFQALLQRLGEYKKSK